MKMTSLSGGEFTLRRLALADWTLLKNVRLEALSKEPKVFGGSLVNESSLPDDYWKNGLSELGKAYFGLFSDEDCVGLTGIFRHRELSDAAILVASYIRKAHRGKGLSSLFYEARIDWAKVNQVKKIIVSHREGNVVSKAANQKFGFVYTHSEDKVWPDGEADQNVFYELNLMEPL